MSSGRNFGLSVVGTSGGQELVLCPWHHDTRPSAWFDPRKELFYCAVCGVGYNAKQLSKRMGITYEEIEFGGEEEPEDYDLLDDEFDSASMLGETYYPHYLMERGVGTVTTERYGVRWEAQQEAIVLPITTIMGKAVGACYRYVHPEASGTRYRKFGEQTPVWPMHHLRGKQPAAGFIIVEGAFSAMKMCDFFYRKKGVFLNVVALLGAKANKKIVDTLAPFQCIFLYDKDAAGIQACKRMREINPLNKSFTLPVSPDDMDDRQLEELMEKLGKVQKEQLGEDIKYA